MLQKKIRFRVLVLRLTISAGSCLLLTSGVDAQKLDPHSAPGAADPYSIAPAPVEAESGIAGSCEHGCQEGSGLLSSGVSGQSQLTIHDMWQRDYEPGNEHQHYSYDTRRLYYYHRPYNMYHIREARSQNSHETALGLDALHPLSHSHYRARAEIFADVNHEIENRHSHSHDDIEDGHLEYVDWEYHKNAKDTWQQDRLSASEADSDKEDKKPQPVSIRQTMRQLRTPSSLR